MPVTDGIRCVFQHPPTDPTQALAVSVLQCFAANNYDRMKVVLTETGGELPWNPGWDGSTRAGSISERQSNSNAVVRGWKIEQMHSIEM